MSNDATTREPASTAAPNSAALGTFTPGSFESQLNPIHLIRRIGTGGMGEVWLGRHKLLGRDVAVKFLLAAVDDQNDPAFKQFIAGAQAAAAIVHPGLNQIYHADVAGGVPYLVLELLDGRNLEEVLRHAHRLPIEAARAIIEAVCQAVAELHQRDLVHRDLKPSNFVLTVDGRVVVTDYGLACARAATAIAPTAGSVAGTPAYMAPEMFNGIVSARTDVYALGICAYQLLCGKPPFSGSLDQLRNQHQNVPLDVQPLRAAGVPDGVIDVVLRATSKDLLFRPKTARHLLDAFIAAFDAAGIKCASRVQLADLLKQCASAEPARAKTPILSDTFAQSLSTIAQQWRKRRGPPHPPRIDDHPRQPTSVTDDRRQVADRRRQRIAAIVAGLLGACVCVVAQKYSERYAPAWNHYITDFLVWTKMLPPPPTSGAAANPPAVWMLLLLVLPQAAFVTIGGFFISLWIYKLVRGQRLPQVDGKTRCGWCQHELRGISLPLCSECGHQIGHSGPDDEGRLPLALQRGHRLRVLIFLYTLFWMFAAVIAMMGGILLSALHHPLTASIGGSIFLLSVLFLALWTTLRCCEFIAQEDLSRSGRAWCRNCNGELRGLIEPVCPQCGTRI